MSSKYAKKRIFPKITIPKWKWPKRKDKYKEVMSYVAVMADIIREQQKDIEELKAVIHKLYGSKN